MESAAKSLRSDLDTIVESSEFFRSVIFPFRTSMALIIMTINYSSLHDTYLTSAEGALDQIVAHLERVLGESIGIIHPAFKCAES